MLFLKKILFSQNYKKSCLDSNWFSFGQTTLYKLINGFPTITSFQSHGSVFSIATHKTGKGHSVRYHSHSLNYPMSHSYES